VKISDTNIREGEL